jgi:hypothetical protein
VEIGEKLGQPPVPPVHPNRVSFIVWQRFVHNPWRKTLDDLLKVLEGSEIYNFPIHNFVHFYSTFWSYACSNRDAGK